MGVFLGFILSDYTRKLNVKSIIFVKEIVEFV